MGDEGKDLAQLLSRAVHDTLDVLVAPSVRHSLVREALRSSGLEEVPTTVVAVHRFVQGPLRDAASRAFGPELAASIAEEIVRVFDHEQRLRASSTRTPPGGPYQRRNTPAKAAAGRAHFRTASPLPAPRRSLTPRPAPQSYVRRQGGSKPRSNPAVSPREYFRRIGEASGNRGALEPAALPLVGRPRVFAVTRDRKLVEALVGWLGEHAEFFLVRSVFTLVRHLQRSQAAGNVLVLDCSAPSVRPTAIAALADELGKTQVVVCRPNVEVDRELAAVSAATAAWTRLHDRDEVGDIAAWCLDLVS